MFDDPGEVRAAVEIPAVGENTKPFGTAVPKSNRATGVVSPCVERGDVEHADVLLCR